ncbi:uncharacterized protein LOC125648343 isoform X3 [Ostrea edulis]|uniref:uncharacterized protein LOC125648343 isoform X3 n=1 Tax=Ostrea edulis TaxID=37623 RepID=UPI0024AF45EF|nr:uncharacterized protein LOC125648343 isoform X3 [Ostrea edulis]
MLAILVYFCLALCVEQTMSEIKLQKVTNWVDANNVCNGTGGTLLSVNETLVNKQLTRTKIWQPLVKIKTKPIITRGCHSSSLITQIAGDARTSMEENNITNCYHFCGVNTPESTTNALLMKKKMCICAPEALGTSYGTADKCSEPCPGNVNDWCGGNSTYSVYEIDNFSNDDHSEGCGSVKHHEKISIHYDNCTEERGAYCTGLSNTDGTRLKNDKKTWDEYNQICEGRLSFFNDTINAHSRGNTNILPSARFWVGHRVWSYVLFGHAVLPNDLSVECALYDNTTGRIEFSSCWENHTYACQKDTEDYISASETPEPTLSETPRTDDAKTNEGSHQVALTAGVTVAVVALFVIVCILVILYKKRRKGKNRRHSVEPSVKQIRGSRNSGTDGVPIHQSETPDNDYTYNHLHENLSTQKDKSDYVYDVGGSCAAGINIHGDDVYNTSNQCSGNEVYDSSFHNSQKSGADILNSDMYSTLLGQNGVECQKDVDLYDHTISSGQKDTKTDDLYHTIH